MAISIDGPGTGVTATVTSDDNLTISNVTVANNDDRILVVIVQAEGSDDPVPATVVYGAQSMTKSSGGTIDGYFFGTEGCSTWYLLAPTVGTADVVITFNASANEDIVAGTISFYGAKQQAPEDADSAESDGDTITSITNNALLIYGAGSTANQAMGTPSGWTEVWDASDPGGNTKGSAGYMIKATAGAEAFTVSNAEGVVSTAWEEETGTSVTVTPSVLTITSSVQAPSILLDNVFSISVPLDITVFEVAPTLPNVGIIMDVLTLTTSVQAPTVVTPNALFVASALSLTASFISTGAQAAVDGYGLRVAIGGKIYGVTLVEIP